MSEAPTLQQVVDALSSAVCRDDPDGFDRWYICAILELSFEDLNQREGQVEAAAMNREVAAKLLGQFVTAAIMRGRFDKIRWLGRNIEGRPKQFFSATSVVGHMACFYYLRNGNKWPSDNQLRNDVNQEWEGAAMADSVYRKAKKTLGLTGFLPPG
jgi:hypothetical protein